MKMNFRVLSIALAFLMSFTNVNAYASNNASEKSNISQKIIVSNSTGKVTNMGVTKYGADYTVIVEPVFRKASSTSDYMIMSSTISSMRTWKVSFVSGVVNCSFYMDIDNNQVVRAYDEKFIGLIFTDVLTTTSAYAKYTLTYGLAIGGFGLTFKGWLKGEVTGSNNDISITYSF